jgi:hypothetical protein
MHSHKVSNDFLKSRTALITGLVYNIEYLTLINIFWILGTVVPLHCDFVVLLRRNYVSYLQEKSHYRTVCLKSGNLFSVIDNGHSSTPFFLKQLKNMVKLVTPENFGDMSTVNSESL